MPMDFHLDTLLNFPNVTIESCLQQSNEVYLKLRFLNEESRCPHCEDLSSELHQVRPIVIRDLSVFGQPTYLKVPRRQFYCRGCQRYFTEVLAFMEAGRHYTRRYEAHIYQQVKLSGIEPVSRVEGLSFDCIQGIFKHQCAQKKMIGGKALDDLEWMNSVSAKDIRTLPPLSGTLRWGR